MKTTHRDYSDIDGDFNRISRFLMENNPAVRSFSTWSLGRFVDWRYGLYEPKPSTPAFWDQNAHMWFDGFGELAGFAISESGGTDFAVITLEGFRFLYGEILEWILANWADRGPRFETEITEHQASEARILERRGFQRTSTFFRRRFDLTRPPAQNVPLEEGFVIVDMETHPDYRQQRILRHDAFSGKDSFSEEELVHELRFYNHSHRGPIYHPATDLCVVAPDGRFAAGCEALIDPRNAEAEIERVCTHRDFRQRGFARAVIQACLERLTEMGLRAAYITGYSPAAIALYGSLGAVDEMKAFTYEGPED